MRRRRRATGLGLAAAGACLAFSVWATATESGDRGLRAESARVDLGDVISGSEATATFTLHNDSAADVRILRAKPS